MCLDQRAPSSINHYFPPCFRSESDIFIPIVDYLWCTVSPAPTAPHIHLPFYYRSTGLTNTHCHTWPQHWLLGSELKSCLPDKYFIIWSISPVSQVEFLCYKICICSISLSIGNQIFLQPGFVHKTIRSLLSPLYH